MPPFRALNLNSAANPIYLARAMLLNDIVPVSVDLRAMSSERRTFASHGHQLFEYDILRLHAGDVRWVKSGDGARVPLAVMGGRTNTSDRLYVGRVLNAANGQWMLGKVWPRRRHMFVGFGRMEVAYNEYEILVFKKAAQVREFEKKVWNE